MTTRLPALRGPIGDYEDQGQSPRQNDRLVTRIEVRPHVRAIEERPQSRVDDRAISRIDYLEDRLINQERTTAGLMGKAFKIKEDVIETLNMTHGSWAEEKRARELLQEHIRTITDVVNRLGMEIKFLEGELRRRENVSEGTSSSVKTLEVQQVHAITDLRGRVGRCDASIAKLSAELKSAVDTIRHLNQTIQDGQSRLIDRIHNMETNYSTLLGRIDNIGLEQEMKMRSMGTDSSQQVTALDVKTRALLEETRGTLKTQHAIEEGERNKMEMRLTNMIEKTIAQRDNNMERMDRKTGDVITKLQLQIEKLEQELAHERERNNSLYHSLEQTLTQTTSTDMKRHANDLLKLKAECREGFSTVHESIANFKEVVDGKRKLLEDQLRREIGAIRKMVVLI